MSQTCCPQYTIRLDARAFKASRQQRQVANRFRSFLVDGAKPGSSGYGPETSVASDTNAPVAGSSNQTKKHQSSPFELDTFFNECTSADSSWKHRFEVDSLRKV
jgi:arginyl-tRNA--protein-N-Asp/Glu arginylyltransferase